MNGKERDQRQPVARVWRRGRASPSRQCKFSRSLITTAATARCPPLTQKPASPFVGNERRGLQHLPTTVPRASRCPDRSSARTQRNLPARAGARTFLRSSRGNEAASMAGAASRPYIRRAPPGHDVCVFRRRRPNDPSRHLRRRRPRQQRPASTVWAGHRPAQRALRRRTMRLT